MTTYLYRVELDSVKSKGRRANLSKTYIIRARDGYAAKRIAAERMSKIRGVTMIRSKVGPAPVVRGSKR